MTKIKLLYILYHSIIILWLIYFAWHDIKTHIVEPKARLLFLPFALASIYINGQLNNNYVKALVSSVIAAAGAFLLFFLLGFLLTKDNSKPAIGGGDIKLMPYIGFIYGIQGTFLILFLSGVFMVVWGIIQKIRRKPDSGAAVPFFAAGAVLCSIFQGINLFV